MSIALVYGGAAKLHPLTRTRGHTREDRAMPPSAVHDSFGVGACRFGRALKSYQGLPNFIELSVDSDYPGGLRHIDANRDGARTRIFDDRRGQMAVLG